MSFTHFIESHQSLLTVALKRYLPSQSIEPVSLHQAIHYAIFNGGKRLRPLLIYAVGDLLKIEKHLLEGPACAVEMIHCYSLIHDDLPAMDNDDLRRGLPACHRAFDEATAILAGDALQALAFEILAGYAPNALNSDLRIQLIQTLARACGSLGMAGGQAMDMAATALNFDEPYLSRMYRKKTGALIGASVAFVILLSSCSEAERLALKNYAEIVGYAFQIHDDILDIEGETKKLGKQTGQDQKLKKLTYPRVTSLHQAKQKVIALRNEALACLKIFSDPHPLIELTHYLLEREV